MINISAIVSPVHVVLGRSMIGKPSLYEHNLTCFFFKDGYPFLSTCVGRIISLTRMIL